MLIRSFPGLMPSAIQHPLDAAATRALEATPGLDLIRKIVTIAFLEKFYALSYAGHCVRVDENQYPSLFRRFRQVAERLDLRRLPELYVKSEPSVNAYAEGTETYYVVLHTGLLDILEEDEVEVVLAHELGHVKCDHMRHMSTAYMLKDVGPFFLQLVNLPLAPHLLWAVQAALATWRQKAEFSADRCALLGTQKPDLVQQALAKLAGFSPKHAQRMNLDSLKRQARVHDEIGAGSFVEKALKVYLMLQEDHPSIVERIREIDEWSQSPAYKRIIEGDYESEPPVLPPGSMCKICPNGHIQPAESLFCSIDGYNLRELPELEVPPESSFFPR